MSNIKDKLKEYLMGKPTYEKFYILYTEMDYDISFIKELYPNEVKTFEDLKFGKHRNRFIEGAVQAFLEFDNGHWVSVVGGGHGFYGDGKRTFEVGFLIPDGGIDVMGWLSAEEVTSTMFNIQMKEPYGK